MATELDRTAVSRLDADGQRYTDRRRQLVGVLSEAGQPLTIPEIVERAGRLPQSSVYRNLAVLERAGVVQRVVTADEWARFELAEDLTEHHHHLICDHCGLVRDFTVSAQLERSIDRALAAAAAEAGFSLDHHRLDLVGLCADCAEGRPESGDYRPVASRSWLAFAAPAGPDAPSPPVPPPFLPPGRLAVLPGRGEVFYRHHEGGEPGAPTVVLLHGWTASADLQWFTAYERLGELYPFIAIDHRGHGRGIRTEERFSLEDAADDVAALCEHLGLTNVVLCGYSMGGPIALHTARRHPGLAAGLVCMATALEWRDSIRDRFQWYGLFFLDILLRSRFSRRWNRFGFLKLTRGRPEVEPYIPWFLGESHRGDPSAMVDAGRALSKYDARSWAAELRPLPVAVVSTTQDQLVKPAKQAALGAALNATFFHLDGDHFVSVARPEAFSAATRAAVDDVAARISGGRSARAVA